MTSEIYKAIYDLLAALSSPSYPIFDHVPQDQAQYPYIKLNSINTTPNDSDTLTELIGTMQIHVWSQYRGAEEVESIQKRVYDTLHRANIADTASYQVFGVDQQFSQVFTEPDGLTRRGVQEFRILYEPIIPD